MLRRIGGRIPGSDDLAVAVAFRALALAQEKSPKLVVLYYKKEYFVRMKLSFRIKGTRYDLSADEVVERLRDVRPEWAQLHTVVVNGVSYPVKQALAVVTGIDRLDFITTQARDIFQRLGFEVHRGEIANPTPLSVPSVSSSRPSPLRPAARRDIHPKQARTTMATYDVELAPTYHRNGFFNARREFDRYLDPAEKAPIAIELGAPQRVIHGRIDRTAQTNGTARIFGGAALRDFFHEEFRVGDTFRLTIVAPNRIRIHR